jgi:hypothetical protein
VLAGRSVERDVPAAARAAGFTLIDLERFTVPTFIWPLRHFVHARARIVPAMPETPTTPDPTT